MSGEASPAGPLRVLILGGGFGGVYAALRLLKRRLRLPRPLELTLVNRDNFFLFTPLLHEVAASDVDLTHIVSPLRKLLPGARLFVGEVESIDLEGRSVIVSHADGGHLHDLEYDHLVLALGSVPNFFGIPGVRERSLTMKSLADAIALRNRLIEVLEEADFECALEQRSSFLTFVVVGGGFAGVETVAAVNDFLRHALRFYAHLDPSQLRVVLLHGGEEILPELGPDLGSYARRTLRDRGVEVRLTTQVQGVSDEGVILPDGTRVPALTVVWTAGSAPHPTVATLPCAEGGRVRVDEHLSVFDWPGVWALGDCALVPDRRREGFHPPTAQHALRQGKRVADNILAGARGERMRAFDYRTIGQLASIGRRTGVARLFGRNFSGFPAWWLWRTVYLAKLPRVERKVRVALDWTLDLFFSKDLVQVKPLSERQRATTERGIPEPAGAAPAEVGLRASDVPSTEAERGKA